MRVPCEGERDAWRERGEDIGAVGNHEHRQVGRGASEGFVHIGPRAEVVSKPSEPQASPRQHETTVFQHTNAHGGEGSFGAACVVPSVVVAEGGVDPEASAKASEEPCGAFGRDVLHGPYGGVVVPEQHDRVGIEGVGPGHHGAHAVIVHGVHAVMEVGDGDHIERGEARPMEFVSLDPEPSRLDLPGVEHNREGEPAHRKEPTKDPAPRGETNAYDATVAPASRCGRGESA
jgi:hypothetical protein